MVPYIILDTVADVEKSKNELLHRAIEDSAQKAQVLTTAANVKLGEIQAIDGSRRTVRVYVSAVLFLFLNVKTVIFFLCIVER